MAAKFEISKDHAEHRRTEGRSADPSRRHGIASAHAICPS
jgi:hypothetical protein